MLDELVIILDRLADYEQMQQQGELKEEDRLAMCDRFAKYLELEEFNVVQIVRDLPE